jgi:Ca2+-binding RTX toxin-like protein
MAYLIPPSTIATQHAISLDTGDDLLVMEGVHLASTNGPAINANGAGHHLIIDGTVANASTIDTILLGNSLSVFAQNRIEIGATGQIYALAADAAVSLRGTGSHVEINGLIRALTGDGIRLGGNGQFNSSSVLNAGMIEAADTAIERRAGTTQVIHVTNSGTILAGDFVYDGNGSTAVDRFINTGITRGNFSFGAGNDLYDGSLARADGAHISGGDGDDVLIGGIDGEALDGGEGEDRMEGGRGGDTYFVDSLKDIVVERAGEGLDTIASRISMTLPAHVENMRFQVASGLSATGNALANVIEGTGGDERLNGAAGIDTLVGFGGRDSFVFNVAVRASNRDKIADFFAPEDTILLDNAVFRDLGKAGALRASAFKLGTKATDEDDRIIYNRKTGAVFYDADGEGGAAAILFAQIATKAALTAADFRVI